MPYDVSHRGSEWVVVNSDSGKVMGTHDTEAEAQSQLRALYANVVKSDSAAEDARSYLRAEITPNLDPLEQAINDARADGYASGSLALAMQPGLEPTGAAQVFGPDLASAWSSWKPGDVDAAALLGDGGFQQMLRDNNFLTDISDTTLDRMGTALAEGAARGLSVDEIAGHLSDLLDDPNRAYTIADTELARATSAASMDTYAHNGIEKWEWLLSPEACPDCEDQQTNNPHTLDEDPPPLHPNCRCSSSPLDPGLLGAPGEAAPAEDGIPDTDIRGLLRSGDLTEIGSTMRGIASDAWGDLGYSLDEPTIVGNTIRFSILDKNGDTAGTLWRSFKEHLDQKIRVDNELFTLNTKHQGKGLATRLAPRLEEWYAKNGVDELTVHANIDVGGYTWAKQGFGWDTREIDGEEIRYLISRVEDAVRSNEQMSELQKLAATVTDDPATWPTPYDLAMYGYKPGDTKWPGKEGLLYSEWRGVKLF